MKLNYEASSLTRVGDIEIPDVFFRRMRTGVKMLDDMFGGDGILPGMTFTIAGGPGGGKTTLMLQLCEALTAVGYKAGYITGEESSVMVAYTCQRLKLSELKLCRETDINKITGMFHDMDFIIVDSFASLLDANGERPNSAEAVSFITEQAKEHECAVGTILHFTKNGQYKGSTDIPHTVDANFMIEIPNKHSPIRNIYSTKNRYGCLYDGDIAFTPTGYDFTEVVDGEEKAAQGNNGKKSTMDLVLDISAEHLTIDRVTDELKVSFAYAKQMLYKHTKAGSLIKVGVGDNAIWKFPAVIHVPEIVSPEAIAA